MIPAFENPPNKRDIVLSHETALVGHQLTGELLLELGAVVGGDHWGSGKQQSSK